MKHMATNQMSEIQPEISYGRKYELKAVMQYMQDTQHFAFRIKKSNIWECYAEMIPKRAQKSQKELTAAQIYYDLKINKKLQMTVPGKNANKKKNGYIAPM